MKKFRNLIAFLMVLTSLAGAQPELGLLDQLLELASPDQIQAYRDLDLRPSQKDILLQKAQAFLPRVRECSGQPGALFALLPEALRQVDTVLDERQRPIARRLVPRPHQVFKASKLLESFRWQN